MNEISANVVVANNIRQHYLRTGHGPALLLLHGWPEWSHVWRPLMARLAADFDLIAPDFRGFGDSEKTSLMPSRSDTTPETLASDILAFATDFGLERFGIVAHDIGGFVGQVIARRAPDRVSSLFFFNCPYPGIGLRWVEPHHLLETWYQFFHQMPWTAELIGSSRETCRIYFREFLRHWSHRKHAFDNELETWVDCFMKPGNLQGGFNWYLSIHATRMAIIEGTAPPPKPIHTPTRIFWGEHDPLFKRSWTDRLPEFFTNLEFSLAPDAGHFVHYETPDQAANEIRRFCHRVLKSR